MSRTKNKYEKLSKYYHKRGGLDRKLREATRSTYGPTWAGHFGDNPEYKYGKPERDRQTDRLKRENKAFNKRFRRYLERDAAREIREELGE